MSDRGLRRIGEGIAFAGLCLACAWIEAYGGNAGLLWVLVVIWAFCWGK